MASYRYAASIIKRSEGRSVTAAAAYRSAEAIHDDRTGVIHDYSRKGGVAFTEVMTPANTPDWMKDRARLWNAVEAAEKRKDSQLAREVQLSIPHELPEADRIELVRTFAKDAFVSKGMIADIAIHIPSKTTDHRNHHAHILLTLRDLTSEGFGLKPRTSTEEKNKALKEERELWALYQNRALEKASARDRVDHRSFKDREIDRLPTVHLGPKAAKLEHGKVESHKGNENRVIELENARKAEKARLELEKANPRRPIPPLPSPRPRRPVSPPKETRISRLWAERDHQRRMALESREKLAILDLDRKHQPQRLRLEDEQWIRNGGFKATIEEELKAIERRQQAKGVTRFFRKLLGKERADTVSRELHTKTLQGVAQREAEERQSLGIRHQQEKARMAEKYQTLREKLEAEIRGRADKQQEYRTTKRPEANHPSLPKPQPKMEPTPPSGTRGRFTLPVRSFDEQVRDYAKTPEGQKDAPKRIEPAKDWMKSAHEPAKEKKDWFNKEAKPEPIKDRSRSRDRD